MKTATAVASIPVERWGKDHWSTLAYVATLKDGFPERERMRCDPRVHPLKVNRANRSFPDTNYPTRLKLGLGTVDLHDDWSCVNDAVEAGYLVASEMMDHHRTLKAVAGTLDRTVRYEVTDAGKDVLKRLEQHGSIGGTYSTFEPHVRPAGVQCFDGADVLYRVYLQDLPNSMPDMRYYAGKVIGDGPSTILTRDVKGKATSMSQDDAAAVVAAYARDGVRAKAELAL